MTDKATPKRVLIEVDWIDSASFPGWQPIDELIRSLDEGNTVSHCHNVGYILQETDDYLAIVNGFDDDNHTAETMFIIPKVAITAVTLLRKGRTR